MAVTIPNSAGYGNDNVDAPEWAQIIPNAGRQYGVLNEASWVARYGSADREVRLSTGTGYGCGIIDRTTAEASIILPASASGSVYHLIHVHRDWNNNRSTFDSKKGTSARELPARDTTPGQADDQPIWLARVDAGKSQVQELVDLRAFGGDGGVFAKDQLVLQYLNRVGTRVVIGSQEWIRYVNSLGSAAWASNDVRPVSAPIALNQGLDQPIYKARSLSQVPSATRSAGRVFLDGAADVVGYTVWDGGKNYTLGYVPEGYRPASEVGAVVRFGTIWASIVVLPNGAIVFALPQNAVANANTLMFAFTGMSWPAGV